MFALWDLRKVRQIKNPCKSDASTIKICQIVGGVGADRKNLKV
jgi:hypothetical protein